MVFNASMGEFVIAIPSGRGSERDGDRCEYGRVCDSYSLWEMKWTVIDVSVCDRYHFWERRWARWSSMWVRESLWLSAVSPWSCPRIWTPSSQIQWYVFSLQSLEIIELQLKFATTHKQVEYKLLNWWEISLEYTKREAFYQN